MRATRSQVDRNHAVEIFFGAFGYADQTAFDISVVVRSRAAPGPHDLVTVASTCLPTATGMWMKIASPPAAAISLAMRSPPSSTYSAIAPSRPSRANAIAVACRSPTRRW